MALHRLLVEILCIVLVDALTLEHSKINSSSDEFKSDNVANEEQSTNPENAFNGVYSECFLQLSFSCLQQKTLLYLTELDKLSVIPVIGDYVKFVKLNISEVKDDNFVEESTKSSDKLSQMIDKAVDNFFNNHLIKLNALGKDILVPRTVEEFVGRKRRKGGGGGHGGGDGDGGKKKMMMMAMMCMKMKLMMMVPAMMGMMGMMSFKGMMFSMMSFMISKMMLLMKILEKKGGGAAGGGGGDGGWAANGGGGAWMPAGGQDYGGGGYDSNAQWSSRAILEKRDAQNSDKPVVTYIKPAVTLNNKHITLKNLHEVKTKKIANEQPKSRRKRGLLDSLQNAYMYWTSKVLGLGYKPKHPNFPKFKIINGVKYFYYPMRQVQKMKAPKELALNTKETELKPIIITEDFNKGEIVEAGVEGRMNRKKFHKLKDNVDKTMDENPWQ